MLTLRQTAEHFRRAEFDLRFALEREVRLAMEAAAETAKGFIGQEMPGWDPLAPPTIADKTRKGYPTPAPLLRTGELRESIGAEAEAVPGGVDGVVGSTSRHASFHEIGSSREPPRPFLGPALMLAEQPLSTALGELAVRVLTPGERP